MTRFTDQRGADTSFEASREPGHGRRLTRADVERGREPDAAASKSRSRATPPVEQGQGAPTGTGMARRAGTVVSSLMFLMMGVGMAVGAASHHLRDDYVAADRAEALAKLIAETPEGARFATLATSVRAVDGSTVAVLDSTGATLSRSGADAEYPRADLALSALSQVTVRKRGPLSEAHGNRDVYMLLPGAEGAGAGEPYMVMVRAPAEETGWFGALTSLAVLAPGLLLLLIGHVSVRLLVKRYAKPLLEFAEAATRVSKHDFSANLDVRSNDEVGHAALAFNRMTRRLENANERLRRAVDFDTVTQLAKREHFIECMRRGHDLHRSGVLVVCNLSRFRDANEVGGRAVGDALLQNVAGRFADAMHDLERDQFGVRDGQFMSLGRLGSDEFGVFAPGLETSGDATLIMRALRNALASPIVIDGANFALSVSCGAVVSDDDEFDPERLIGRAKAALARGRSQGAGVAAIYDRELDHRRPDCFVAETAILDAIAQRRIVPYFQPKVDLTSGKITSAEALARWVVPGRGVLEPSAFIAAIENLGLIGALGETILRQSCEAAAAWQREGVRCRVAVNVAPTQFEDPAFASKVFAILSETGLAPDLLELEITESTAMRNVAAANKRVAPLRKAGVRLSLDDFGVGHSSLAMLTQMPFDIFKIDRQFVMALESDDEAGAVVETILSLARSLNFETVAEGIETPQQEVFLRKRGCTMGQGYLYGRPMPLQDFLIAAKNSGRRGLRVVGKAA